MDGTLYIFRMPRAVDKLNPEFFYAYTRCNSSALLRLHTNASVGQQMLSDWKTESLKLKATALQQASPISCGSAAALVSLLLHTRVHGFRKRPRRPIDENFFLPGSFGVLLAACQRLPVLYTSHNSCSVEKIARLKNIATELCSSLFQPPHHTQTMY